MGSKNGKTAQKRLKKCTSFSESKSDSELPKFVVRKNSWINDTNSPVKLKANGESFTPFTKIPAIGEKVSSNIINYHSDSDTIKIRGPSSKIPILRSHSVNKNNVKFSPKIEEPKPVLVRGNTYVVLNPVICIKQKEKDFSRTYIKCKSDNINERSAVFGSKLIDMLESDSEDNKKVNNIKNEVRKNDLSALNYLFNNLNLSRSRKSNLLLSKNNPWLL
ncbi:hypothetical protein RI129_006737 [Pyrocoelia pectoralis]|uniref:Uncharacterized protein n=1 Tax=Pyrocoelia pectoralis TaxID=417401 RepID=A0AAN7ZIR7_9COLE